MHSGVAVQKPGNNDITELVVTDETTQRETGRRLYKKHRRRWSWVGRSVKLQEAKVDEAATHRSLTSAAAVQPSWNSSSRWRQSRKSSRLPSGYLTCSSSQPQATTVHQGPLRTARKRAITHEEGAGEQWEEEQRNAAKRKCGERAPGGRNQGFPADFFCKKKMLLYLQVMMNVRATEERKPSGHDANAARSCVVPKVPSNMQLWLHSTCNGSCHNWAAADRFTKLCHEFVPSTSRTWHLSRLTVSANPEETDRTWCHHRYPPQDDMRLDDLSHMCFHRKCQNSRLSLHLTHGRLSNTISGMLANWAFTQNQFDKRADNTKSQS